MFDGNTFLRSANKPTLVTCLLAFTALLAGSWQAQSQAPIHRNNETILNPVLSGRLSDHTAPQILEGSAIRTEHYSPEKKLRLVLSIRPPHMAEEEQFLRDLTDKKSPNFHKFLSQDEWNARFAPSADDEQKVVDWAKSAGLTVTKRYNHRLIVDAEATSGAIEKAFDVTINTYKLGEQSYFANDRDPVLPNELSGILYNVQGLNNIQHDHSAHPSNAELHAPDFVEGPVVANGGAGHGNGDPVKAKAMLEKLHAVQSKTGQDMFANGPVANLTDGVIDPYNVYSSQMYDYGALQALGHCCNPHGDSGGAPNVSNIAIAGFGQFLESDLNTFASDFGLAYFNNYYYIDGTPFCNSNGTCDTGETTEDVEYSIAMSNSFGSYLDTAHNYEYLGGNGNNSTYTDIYSQMLSDNTARVMTTSWSCTENYGCSTSTMDSRHAIFANMVGAGWTLIAASGDRGATDDCSHTSIAYPASDYLVVAAGGTQLDLYSDGTWYYENGWQGGAYAGACGQNNGGSGGGVSTYYAKQSWQNTFGGSFRLTPDISLNALGLAQIEVEGGSLCCSANGTSVVAPELAGFFAQENAYLNYIGNKCSSSGTTVCTPIGNPLPFVYEEGNSKNAAHVPFYDITSGCNSNDITAAGSLTYYCSHSSYDLVTGWGSANMLQLAYALNWEVTGADGGPSVSFSGPATNTWYNTNQQVNWTINDNPGSGFTSANAVGIAGEAQGWDSIENDSYTEPHGGSGDFFWDGPQFPNGSTGCLALVANGCVGGVSQGCHTVHVRGWNNQGEGTGDQTYGPICYDTVLPTVTPSQSPAIPASGWNTGSVTVTLTATDPGGSNASGIYKTFYAIDTYCAPTSQGSCTVYSGAFAYSTQGSHYIYYFTEDNAGNYSALAYVYVYIDTIAPATTASLSGTLLSGSTYQSAVNVTLNATDASSGVQTTYYEIDGGSALTYTGSAVNYSTIGNHNIKYWSVDAAGNTEAAHVISFTVESPTTATLTATPNPSTYGQAVKMTATITASLAGNGAPTGSVIFYNGATNLGTVTLSGGTASLSVTTLPAGALTLQVTYVPTGYFITTNSPPFDQTVHHLTQTITFPAITGTEYVGHPLTLSATASSGLAVTLASATTPVCTVSGSTATLLKAGTCTIHATQAGNDVYAAATTVSQSFTVSGNPQTVTFPALQGNESATYNLTLSGSASSGLAVAFSSTTPSICTVSGNIASLLISGTCTLQASQAGNTYYAAATPVAQTFTVHHLTQTINFPAITATEYAGNMMALSATSTSGLAVSFASATTPICTVSGTTATLLKAGTCSIHATQAGNSVYEAATTVAQSFTVSAATNQPQTITFPTITGNETATFNLTLSATASSGLAVTFSSTTPTVCTVSGNTASQLISGTCTITASQAGNTTYVAATPVSQSFTVHHLTQTITFPTIATQTVGTPLALSATASSGLAVTFASTTASVCTVSGTTATMVAAGTCNIHAAQAGNSVYAGATTLSQSFTVNP